MGKIHSIQTLGATDGPGVRFTVFMQGCPLRCACCHNPDTWDFDGGKEESSDSLTSKAERYKEYFGALGGVTVSGGEPLLQAKFITEFFTKCHQKGINTCLDTSGCVLNDEVKALLSVTDLVMLDVKYTTEEKYKQYVGCSISSVLEFLDYLEAIGMPYYVRQVIIPHLNDSENDINELKSLLKGKKHLKKIELLPFKKLCEVKYENLGIDFPLKDTPEPTSQKMQELNQALFKEFL